LNCDSIVSKIHEATDRYGSHRRPVNPQQYDQLRFALARSDQAKVFHALHGVFRDGSRSDDARREDQEYAGRLLYDLRPPCPLPLPDAVKATLAEYAPDVEQLPFYFAAVFGRDALGAALSGLEAGPLTERERRSLDAFQFYLRHAP